MAFSKVILVGNLVADPELRHTPNGVAVTSIRLAVNRRFKSEENQTDFIDVVCWRQTAEFVAKYFAKGRSILVCGSLQTRTYDDRETGKKRTAYEVVADEVSFVGPKNSSEYTPSAAASQSTAFASAADDFVALPGDDELPF